MAFKIKKVRPLFTGVVTTAQKYRGEVTTDAGLVLANKLEGQLNIYQTVVAVGKMVSDLKPGDVVCVNYKRYFKPVHVPGVIEDNVQSDKIRASYEIPSIEIDGQQYLFLQNNDIEFVVEEYDIDEGGLFQ